MNKKNSPYRGLKVLKLEFWQETDWMREDCAIEIEHPPVSISRNGWYALGKTSWFVVEGKSYTSPHLYSSFEYNIDLDFSTRYDTKQIAAIEQLIKLKLPISSLQRKILNSYRDYLGRIRCYRESQLYLKKFLTKKKI